MGVETPKMGLNTWILGLNTQQWVSTPPFFWEGVETHLRGVETHFGDVETHFCVLGPIMRKL